MEPTGVWKEAYDLGVYERMHKENEMRKMD